METLTISSFARWQVKAGKIDTVLELLSRVAVKCLAEEGNLLYHAYQHHADKNIILLFEQYKSEEALESHRNSPHYQEIVMGRIAPLLEDREVTLAREIDLVPPADHAGGG